MALILSTIAPAGTDAAVAVCFGCIKTGILWNLCRWSLRFVLQMG